jgi:hypothetical protein
MNKKEKLAQSTLRRASSELQRIHQELRVFIKESLIDLPDDDFDEVFKSTTESAVPLVVTNLEQKVVPDELEELAKRIFAKSPELGLLSQSVNERSDKAQEERPSAENADQSEIPPSPMGF